MSVLLALTSPVLFEMRKNRREQRSEGELRTGGNQSGKRLQEKNEAEEQPQRLAEEKPPDLSRLAELSAGMAYEVVLQKLHNHVKKEVLRMERLF